MNVNVNDDFNLNLTEEKLYDNELYNIKLENSGLRNEELITPWQRITKEEIKRMKNEMRNELGLSDDKSLPDARYLYPSKKVEDVTSNCRIPIPSLLPPSGAGSNLMNENLSNIVVETVVDEADAVSLSSKRPFINKIDVPVGRLTVSVPTGRELELLNDEEYKKILNNINFEGLYIYNDDDPDSVFDESYRLSPEDEKDMDELNEHFFFLTAKTMRQSNKDVAPVCIVKLGSIGGVPLDKPLLCLLDTSSMTTMIQWKALPAGCVPMKSNVKSIMAAANGTFDTSMSVSLRDIAIPEFVNNGRIVDGIWYTWRNNI